MPLGPVTQRRVTEKPVLAGASILGMTGVLWQQGEPQAADTMVSGCHLTLWRKKSLVNVILGKTDTSNSVLKICINY